MQAAIWFLNNVQETAMQAEPDDLVKKHLPDATKLAYWWYKRQGQSALEDLQGEACLALCEAAAKFKDSQAYKNDTPFKAYASAVIVQKLKAATAKGTSMKVTSHRRKDALAIKKLDEGQIMSDAEACEVLGWEQRRLNTARAALQAMVYRESLDAQIYTNDGGGGDTVGNRLPDTAPGPEEAVLEKMGKAELKNWLAQAVSELPPAARRAVSLRFGVPVVQTERIALQEVIAIVNNFTETRRGMLYLREVRQREHGDTAPVVDGNKATSFDGRYAGKNAASEAGKSLAFDIWKRYSDGPEGPPALH